MAKEEIKDLLKFLEPFKPGIREIALQLREFVWDLYPRANELIYDNYNAVAFGWSLSDRVGDTFCSIAVGSDKYVHFGFYWGSKIADPRKILLGNGNQYRYIKVTSLEDFPKAYIKSRLKDAYAYSSEQMKATVAKSGRKNEIFQGDTIVKSISPVKKRPGIVPAKKSNRNSKK
jgi:Domain of unknown function (DU1801)